MKTDTVGAGTTISGGQADISHQTGVAGIGRDDANKAPNCTDSDVAAVAAGYSIAGGVAAIVRTNHHITVGAAGSYSDV